MSSSSDRSLSQSMSNDSIHNNTVIATSMAAFPIDSCAASTNSGLPSSLSSTFTNTSNREYTSSSHPTASSLISPKKRAMSDLAADDCEGGVDNILQMICSKMSSLSTEQKQQQCYNGINSDHDSVVSSTSSIAGGGNDAAMTDNNVSHMIQAFMSVLLCAEHEAEFFLESADWNVATAVNIYLENRQQNVGYNDSSSHSSRVVDLSSASAHNDNCNNNLLLGTGYSAGASNGPAAAGNSAFSSSASSGCGHVHHGRHFHHYNSNHHHHHHQTQQPNGKLQAGDSNTGGIAMMSAAPLPSAALHSSASCAHKKRRGSSVGDDEATAIPESGAPAFLAHNGIAAADDGATVPSAIGTGGDGIASVAFMVAGTSTNGDSCSGSSDSDNISGEGGDYCDSLSSSDVEDIYFDNNNDESAELGGGDDDSEIAGIAGGARRRRNRDYNRSDSEDAIMDDGDGGTVNSHPRTSCHPLQGQPHKEIVIPGLDTARYRAYIHTRSRRIFFVDVATGQRNKRVPKGVMLARNYAPSEDASNGKGGAGGPALVSNQRAYDHDDNIQPDVYGTSYLAAYHGSSFYDNRHVSGGNTTAEAASSNGYGYQHYLKLQKEVNSNAAAGGGGIAAGGSMRSYTGYPASGHSTNNNGTNVPRKPFRHFHNTHKMHSSAVPAGSGAVQCSNHSGEGATREPAKVLLAHQRSNSNSSSIADRDIMAVSTDDTAPAATLVTTTNNQISTVLGGLVPSHSTSGLPNHHHYHNAASSTTSISSISTASSVSSCSAVLILPQRSADVEDSVADYYTRSLSTVPDIKTPSVPATAYHGGLTDGVVGPGHPGPGGGPLNRNLHAAVSIGNEMHGIGSGGGDIAVNHTSSGIVNIDADGDKMM